MPEFDPLVDDLDALEGKVLLISASAGTGKTWMVAHLAARWLLESEEHDPASLLMVTFSRAAALELRARLRGTIVEIRSILAGSLAPTDRWTESLMDEAVTSEAERLRLVQRVAEVLARLDDVNARTIHSFAAMMSDTGSATITAGSAIYERAVNETLTRAAIQNLDALRTLIDDHEVETTTGRLSSTELRRRILSTARAAVGLGGLAPDRSTPSKAHAVLPPEPDPGLEPDPDTEPDARAVGEAARVFLELVVEVERRARQMMHLEATVTFDSMISGAYADAMSDERGIIESLRAGFGLVLIDEFQDTDGAQWAIFDEAFVGHVPVVLVGDPKQAIYTFRGGDVVIFQQLLSRAEAGDDQLLTHELDQNFRSSKALLGRLNALFMAAEEPSIVEYFGQVETARGAGLARPWAFSSPIPGSEELHAIEYAPVIAGRDHEGGRLVVRDLTESVPLLRRGDDGTRPVALPYEQPPKDGPNADEIRERLVGDVVATVLGQLAGGRTPGELCILVRTNTFADQLCTALRKAGVAVVTSKSTPVFESRAAIQLRCLLFALIEPTNPRRAGLLRSTWFCSHDPDELPSMGRALEEHGPGALCRRALDTATMHHVLGSEDPQRHWTDLEHLFELLALEHPDGVTASVALGWLESMMTTSVEDEAGAQAAARRVDGDGSTVTIMTSHGAKGLEFPVVLVPGVESWPGSKDHATQGGVLSTPDGRVFDLARLSEKSIQDDSESSIAEELQRTDEAARLIYVALTRAKEELVIWITDLDRHVYNQGERASISKTSLWRVLLESLLVASDDELAAMRDRCEAAGIPFDPTIELVKPETTAMPSASAPLTAEALVSTEGVVAPPRIEERTRRWSYSSLQVHGTDEGDLLDAELDDGSADPDGRAFAEDVAEDRTDERSAGTALFGGHAGTVAGNAIHQVYEEVVGVLPSTESERLASVVASCFDAAGLPLADPARVASEFAATLSWDLGDLFDGQSLDQLTVANGITTANEMRFTLPLQATGSPADQLVRLASLVAETEPDGPFSEFFSSLAEADQRKGRLFQGFLTGSIDLVAQVGTDEPQFVLLDYKSNLLKDATRYAPDQLLGEMALSGYPLQGLLYSVALHRFLARRLSDYDPARHLGGVCYFYVRGAALPDAQRGDGLVSWSFSPATISGVSDLLAGRVVV